MRRGVRRAASIAAAAALVAAAGAIVAATPGDDQVFEVLRVDGAVGERLVGRVQTATVTGVELADTLRFGYAGGTVVETEGVWLVADITVVDRIESLSLTYVQLEIGDRVFNLYRGAPYPTATSFESQPGIPYAGPIAFELPREVLDDPARRDARLVVRYVPDGIVETVPVVHLDLTDLEVEARADLDEARTLTFDEAGEPAPVEPDDAAGSGS